MINFARYIKCYLGLGSITSIIFQIYNLKFDFVL